MNPLATDGTKGIWFTTLTAGLTRIGRNTLEMQ